MHFGQETAGTVAQLLQIPLRNCWRLGLMVMLLAMTCWEVNPGNMPVPENGTARFETSVVVAEEKAGLAR